MNNRRIERETNLRDYFIVIDKRKWTIILSIIIVVFLSIVFMPSPPPLYKATAIIVVEEPATESPLLEGLVDYYPGALMETQKKLVKSQFLAEEVVWHLWTEMARSLKMKGDSAEWLDLKKAPAMVRKSLSAREVKDTNFLEISATVDDPKKAMNIANTAARICVVEGRKGIVGGVEGATEFIEKQLQIFKKKLMDSEEALARYKAEKGFGPLTVGVSEMDTLEEQYIKTKLERQIAEARLKVLKEKFSNQQKEITPAILQTQSSLVAKLRETLVELELKRALLLREFTEKHPEVVELQTEIDETVEVLKEETSKAIASGGMAADPWSVYQHRNKQIADLEVEIDSAKIREDSLRKLLNEYSSKKVKQAGHDAELLRLTQKLNTNKKTYSILLDMRENLNIATSLTAGNVRIYRLATEPKEPVEQGGKMRLLVSSLLGLVLGVSVAFAQEHMDTSLKTIDDIERYLNKPVLGVIPIITPTGKKKKRKGRDTDDERSAIITKRIVTNFKPKSPEAEAYRTLRTNITHAGLPEGTKMLLATSSYPGEGKTVTMVNLGITMAEMGKRVLMVDADIRRPVLHNIFGQDKAPGLAEILQGRIEWDKALQPSGKENLSMITSGTIPPNPAELIASDNMKNFLDEVRPCFDIILLDCPSVLAVTDAAELSPLMDGVLLVVRAEKTPRESAQRAIVLLENVESKIIGVVFNGVSARRSYYYYYYRYKYRYEEENRLTGTRLWNIFFRR